MDDHVIDAPAAELEAAHDLPNPGPVFGKQIQSQRFGLIRQPLVQFFKPVISENGQDGSKNLFLHHRIFLCDGVQNGGSDLQGLHKRLPAKDCFIGINQPQQTVKMFLVDDFAIVWILQRLLTVLPPDFPAQQLHQPVLHTAVAENIVRGHTGLAAVEVLAEYNAPGRQRQLGSFIYDAGAFAAQLQHRRGQALRRVAQDLTAYGLTAGKEDKIKLFLQQRSILLSATGDHSHILRRKALAYQPRQQNTGSGRVGAGFHHSGISSGDSIGQRVQGQQYRVVPRAHNQSGTVGGRLPEAASGKLGQGCGDSTLPRQTAHMLEHPIDLPPHKASFTHKAFVAALTQVGSQGLSDFLFIAVYRPQELSEHLLAKGDRQRSSSTEEAALTFNNFVDIHKASCAY